MVYEVDFGADIEVGDDMGRDGDHCFPVAAVPMFFGVWDGVYFCDEGFGERD